MSSWHRQEDFQKWRWHTCEPLLFKERSASFLHKGLHSGPFWIIPKITSRKRFFQGYLFKFCLLWTTAATATKTSLKKWICATSNFIKSCQQVWGTRKPTFYTFYTSHLRWNSTMRRCFYHTDLGQNAVFHNFAIQIALTPRTHSRFRTIEARVCF